MINEEYWYWLCGYYLWELECSIRIMLVGWIAQYPIIYYIKTNNFYLVFFCVSWCERLVLIQLQHALQGCEVIFCRFFISDLTSLGRLYLFCFSFLVFNGATKFKQLLFVKGNSLLLIWFCGVNLKSQMQWYKKFGFW